MAIRRKTLRSPRRAHRERRRRLTLVFLAFLLVAGVCGGLLYLLSLPVFNIQRIEIRGTEALSPDEVQTFAEERLSGRYFGVIPRRSVFFYPREALARGLSAALPRVEKAEFRMLSASLLTIFVTERKAAAMLCTAQCFLVDESGFVFAPAGAEANLLRLKTSGEVSVGSRFLSGERLAPLLSFMGALHELGFSLSEVRVEGEEGTVLFHGGARLLFRLEPEYGKVQTRLQTLVSEKELFSKGADSIQRLEYIDLRYGNKIYFKPK